VRGAREVAAADDQAPRDDPGPDDLALVVDVVDEAVQRADALREAALDVVPLGRGQDPRDQVERERAVLDGAVLAGGVERDALLDEDRVAPVAGGRQQLRAQARDLGGERDGVRAGDAVRAEDLVEVPGGRPVGRGVVGDQVGQGADPVPKATGKPWICVEIGGRAGVRAVEEPWVA
jgi:hypothetical protein